MTDQKIIIPFCPIQRPTEKQFQNFYDYIQKIQSKYKNQYGMVKIVPPKNWKSHGENYEDLKKQMKIKKPIQQHARMSKNDYYQIRNIIQESMNFKRFQKSFANKSFIKQTAPQKVQQTFWKTIKYTPPIYGADLNKSLMSPIAGSWNLGKLDSLLTNAAPVLIKGVTYPYCYVGTWKSIFCWHKQDLDLSAINYLHEGKQKFWYSIQHDNQHILQDEAKQAFPQIFASCKNFMRHKTTLINPYKLKQKHPQLKISKAYQGPNEFIVVFCGSYHCGFNSGKNLAQAVNFATTDWLKKLEKVNFCQCTERSVRPDYKYFVDNLESKKSSFRQDIAVKQFKNWTVKHGLYKDLSTQEIQNEEQENEGYVQEQKEEDKKKKSKKIRKVRSVKEKGKGKKDRKVERKKGRSKGKEKMNLT